MPCVSQEYAKTANDEYEVVGQNIDRVEDLVHQLVHQRRYSREMTSESLNFDVSKSQSCEGLVN